MSGIFSSKTPTVAEALPPAAPIEEASFEPGKAETDTDVKKRKIGKKRLQIPLGTTASTGTGVATGL